MSEVTVDPDRLIRVMPETLANKIAAYALQQDGLDTVDANRALGLPDDARRYRDPEELEIWKKRDPLLRLRRYLDDRKLWDDAREEIGRAHV